MISEVFSSMEKSKKEKVLNIVFIILEMIGFIISYLMFGRYSPEYYTEDANLFSLIVCIMYLCYLCNNIKIPRWLEVLRLSSIICLVLTFIIVIVVLLPTSDVQFMFGGANLFFHLLCPVFLLFLYLYIDKKTKLNSMEILYACMPTIIYGIIMAILNILKTYNGPYPFLKIYEQSFAVSLLWEAGILCLAYFIGYFLNKWRKKAKLK